MVEGLEHMAVGEVERMAVRSEHMVEVEVEVELGRTLVWQRRRCFQRLECRIVSSIFGRLGR